MNSYTINEIPLDNDTFGWRVLRRSQPLLGLTKRLQSVEIPGRHGVLPGVPSFKGAPSVTFVISTPGTGVEPLYALLLKNGGSGILRLTDDTDRAAQFELASIDPQGLTEMDKLVDVSFTLRFPTADWRATARTTEDLTVTDPVETHEILDGIGSDIIDADIFIGGDFGNFELYDTGSDSWLKTILTWTHVADTGLLYVGATGQAFRAATASPWTPLADMSDHIDVSGGGGFRITPQWTTDPSDRIAELELTTTNQSGVSFKVRAYNAYALRDGEV